MTQVVVQLEEVALQAHRYVHLLSCNLSASSASGDFTGPSSRGKGGMVCGPWGHGKLFTQFTASASSLWLEVRHPTGKQARKDWQCDNSSLMRGTSCPGL